MLIDVSLRIEDGMVFRPGSPPVELREIACSSQEERQYATSVLSTPTHVGTHVDVVHATRTIAPSRFVAPGKLIDVPPILDRAVCREDLDHPPAVNTGDFVLFRTGWDQHLGSAEYFQHPELGMAVIEWLADEQVNMAGIDAAGLARLASHGLVDHYLANRGVYIIENLANLQAVKEPSFTVYCFPLNIAGSDALPARVLIET